MDKTIVGLALIFLFSNICLGADPNVCATLSNVLAANQDRFDQAEIALNDVNAICKDDPSPKQCNLDIENEFNSAKQALEKSKLDFSKAGCEENKTYIINCSASDTLEREYLFELNVGSGEIRKKAAHDSSWSLLYNTQKKCGLTLGSATCEQRLVHNIDNPEKPHFAVKFGVNCKTAKGRPLPELGGRSEINSSGDGYGTFVCGKLPSNDLNLSNCSLDIQ